VGHLEALRLALEGGEAVGAEEPVRRIERVAPVAVEDDVGDAPEVEVAAKSVNACISASVSSASRPMRPGKATLNFLNAASSSKTLPPGSLPPVRSPRQCIEPAPAMPRRLCVVIGPFSGWKSRFGIGMRKGMGFVSTTSSGLPRSQARLSKSPKTWQLEHDASPLLDVATAS
jgi:hypothetical protein